jgi:hypothetical protein
MKILLPITPPTLSVTASIEVSVIKRRWPLSDYIECRDEIWTHDGIEPTPITACYTKENNYVGDIAFAKYLIGQCIHPELASPEHSVCSIGYSRPKNMWFGWSHRACIGFTIGDKLFDPEFGDDTTPFIQHGRVVITNMDQARQSAVNFARDVS